MDRRRELSIHPFICISPSLGVSIAGAKGQGTRIMTKVAKKGKSKRKFELLTTNR